MSNAGAPAPQTKRRGIGWIWWLAIGIAAVLLIAILATVLAPKPQGSGGIATNPTSSDAQVKCFAAMRAAGQVEDIDNNTELYATVDACANTDDWVAALQAYPAAGSLSSYTVREAEEFLSIICVKAAQSATCVDAAKAGRLH